MTSEPRPTRTLVASVLFVDLVDFSRASNTEQIEVKRELSRILRRILSSIPEDDYRLMDTGDGAALGFIADPEHALYVALAIDTACNGNDPTSGIGAGALRIGINLGPVTEVVDINNRPGLIGDGMNTAQRIAGFAKPGQTTISRSFFELVSRLAPEYQDIFVHVGEHDDKHGREHDIYALKAAKDILGKIQERLQLNVAEATGINVVFARNADANASGAGEPQRKALWPRPPMHTAEDGHGARRRRLMFGLAIGIAVGIAIVAVPTLTRMGTREQPAATPERPVSATVAPAATDTATGKPPPVGSSATPPIAPAAVPTNERAKSTPADSAPGSATQSAVPMQPAPDADVKTAPRASTASTPGKRPAATAGASRSTMGEDEAPKSTSPASAGTAAARGTYSRCSALMQKATLGEAITPAERREIAEFCR